MEMLVVFAKAELREEIELLLTKQGVPGSPRLPMPMARGPSGVRMGSAVHPKTSVMVMMVVETEMRKQIVDLMKEYQKECNCHVSCVYWPVESSL
jgi:hypothetical protein